MKAPAQGNSAHRWMPLLLGMLCLVAAARASWAQVAEPDPLTRSATTQPSAVQQLRAQRRDAGHAISVLMVGGDSATDAGKRLTRLGCALTTVSPERFDPDNLDTFDLIFLATQWAENPQTHDAFARHAPAIHAYLRAGGAMLVSQPNPSQHPGATVISPILPYPVKFHNDYDIADSKNRVLLDGTHPVTQGFAAAAMPFPADQMTEVDERYTVLAKGGASGSPSLLVTTLGRGRVLVQTANESDAASDPLSDAIVKRMLAWCAGREDDPEPITPAAAEGEKKQYPIGF